MNVSLSLRRNIRLLCIALLIPVLLNGMHAQTSHFSYAQVTLGSGFSGLSGVAVDGSGNVFVADTGNNAVKEILAAGGYVTVSTLGSGFSAPSAVAVDGSGNVFVADTGHSAVKEILAAGGYVTVNPLGSGFVSPSSVAVDGNGNVFVTDASKNAVYEILAAGGYTTVNTVAGSGFSSPSGVAVDGSGNVFVADSGNNAVKEILAMGGYTTVNTLVSSGFSSPIGIAVDGSGNVFVADSGNNAVKEIPNGCASFTCVSALGGALSGPTGVALDRRGNVVIADNGNSRVAELEMASVDFGTVAIGQASGKISLTFTFDSGGSIGIPVALTQGLPGLDFAAASTGTCTTNGTAHVYVIGDSCTVDVTFAPTVAGLRYGAALLQDGSGNTIAMGYVHGIGSGPQVSFLPGSQSNLGSGFGNPSGVAVDASGNVFFAESSKGAVKEILAAGGYTTVRSLGSGFNFPLGVAVDGSGNVFVTDYGNNAVYEILAAGGYTAVKTLGSGFVNPFSVAVDGNGNVFVADYGHSLVKEILAAGGYTTVNTLGSNFAEPSGVAVDGNGNVFVTDYGHGFVKEILAAGGYTTVRSLGSGFVNPFGIALDGNGNVFVTDATKNTVSEILAAGGYTTVNTLAGSGFSYPEGVAVDGSGNVYVADWNNTRLVKLDYADAPSLNFTTPTYVGSTDTTDGPQTVTIQNIGNTALTFQPFVVINLSNAALTGSTVNDCSELTGLHLEQGAQCTLGIEFAPSAAGPLTGFVNVVDNALNSAAPSYTTQSIPLKGTGILQTQTINVPVLGTQTYGVAPIMLTATASSGLAVSYTVTAGPATVSGSTLTITGAGEVTVQAMQVGNSSYAAATPVGVSFAVTPATLMVTASNQARLYGVANPPLTYLITGFVNGDTSAVISGSASLTTTATATSPVGAYPITFLATSLTASNYSFTYVNGTLTVYNTSLPFVLGLSASTATAGDTGFTLTVNGENFVSSSQVLWNGAMRTTTYISSTQLNVVILAGDIANEGTNLVTVASTTPIPNTLAAQPFVVQSSTPVATITGASLADSADGSGNHTLTLTGTNFVSGSTIEWSGASLATNYVSPWQLSAVVSSNEYVAQPAKVTVMNPAGTSAGFELQ